MDGLKAVPFKNDLSKPLSSRFARVAHRESPASFFADCRSSFEGDGL